MVLLEFAHALQFAGLGPLPKSVTQRRRPGRRKEKVDRQRRSQSTSGGSESKVEKQAEPGEVAPVTPREFDVHSRWKPEREAEEKRRKEERKKKKKKKKNEKKKEE
eukprot:s51_g9.t1